MRIGKPLILTITPLGVGLGLYEAYGFGWGIFLLMIALMTFISLAIYSIVRVARRESREANSERKPRDD